ASVCVKREKQFAGYRRVLIEEKFEIVCACLTNINNVFAGRAYHGFDRYCPHTVNVTDVPEFTDGRYDAIASRAGPPESDGAFLEPGLLIDRSVRIDARWYRFIHIKNEAHSITQI